MSTGFALVICCVAVVINDARALRNALTQQYETLSQVLASNSTAALSFGQDDAASELLSSLRHRPEVTYACFIDTDNRIVAEHHAIDATEEHTHLADAAQSLPHPEFDDTSRFLILTTDIEEAGEHLGWLRLVVSLDELQKQTRSNLIIVSCMLVVSLGVGFVLAIPMQRSIAQPILDLASIADDITRDGDYSKRVSCPSQDEIGVLYERFNGMLEHIQHADEQLRAAHHELEDRVARRTEMLLQSNGKLREEMAAREQTVQKLKRTQDELMEASRRAGMADIADGVLHNIGNVLNSVNVSASLAVERASGMRISGLQNAVALINEHQSQLGDFFTNDPRGKQLPLYFQKLSDAFATDQKFLGNELNQLTKNVNHIKEIVRTQQSYASMGGVILESSPTELMDDAFQFVERSLVKHEIHVTREYDSIDGFHADKGKLLQILINLIKNAKEAILAYPDSKRDLLLRVYLRDGMVGFQVTDTGIGIPEDKLTQIFRHGFTTKKNGHGFGLHASANAANEMGGAMIVRSEGVGQGATFIVEVPLVVARRTEPTQELSSPVCALSSQGTSESGLLPSEV